MTRIDYSTIRVSRFPNHYTLTPTTYPLDVILRELRDGAPTLHSTHRNDNQRNLTLKSATTWLRGGTVAGYETIPESVIAAVRKQEKTNFPCITPAGITNDTRTAIDTPSGLVLVEWDNLADPASTFSELTALPHIAVCWTTLSGNGIAALIPVNPAPNTRADYQFAYAACAVTLEHLPTLDTAASRWTQARALVHDPHVHVKDTVTPIAWEADTELRDSVLPREADNVVLEATALPAEYIERISELNVTGTAWYGLNLPCLWETHENDTDGISNDNATGVKRVRDGYKIHCFKCGQKRIYAAETAPQGKPTAPPAPPIVDIVQEDEKPPLQLPKAVYEGIFESYCEAYKGKTEVAPEYNFACLYTAVGAICGRRYYLNEVSPIYPNAYTAIVGQSALARKTTAINAVRNLLGQCAEDVYNLTALSTPEGLLNLFVPDRWEPAKKEGDEQKLIPGGLSSLTTELGDGLMDTMIARCADEEGFRIMLTLDEIAKMLRKAGSASSSGLMELLADMFGYPSRVQLPTRTNPLSAEFPCLTILGATTYEWFESAFQEEDIHGGIANRFLYFYDPPKLENHFISKPPDSRILASVAKQLNGLRDKFGNDTKAQLPFHWTDDAVELGTEWYQDLRYDIENEENIFVAHAMGRADLYLKKSALIHAILFNDVRDTCITIDNIAWAMNLMEYLIRTTREIYNEFNTSQQKRVEERILAILRKTPWQSKNTIHKRMRWASRKDVSDTIDMLVKGMTLAAQPTAQTIKYAVAADA